MDENQITRYQEPDTKTPETKMATECYKIGVDTGGTFTDFVIVTPEGRILRWKTLSTPSSPTDAIMKGIQETIGDVIGQGHTMVHGTTIGTNAFLERKGARTCLITTRGFEDVLFIGRQARERLYDLFLQMPEPIIDEEAIFGLSERMAWDGTVIDGISLQELKRAKAFVKEKGAQSVACVFLHSYANPAHELMVKEHLSALGIPVYLSSETLPRFREFERLTTTLINAYIGPVVGDYIERLERLLKGVRVFIQSSSGGAMRAQDAGRQAVHTILSGPAAGAQGALALSKELGIENVITFDMGGTSTDCTLIPGDLQFTRDYKLQGFPVAIPIIAIHTVGAGGGSIAWIDKGGALKVGPKSAGADPGPICYGKGEEVTVTDANLFLGRLRPENFLKGRMKLYPERIPPRIEHLSSHLNLSPEEVALGIIRIVNTNMIQAIRAISIEKGIDPRAFTLMTFGGAGGLHAAEIAQELGIKKILFPRLGGVFSALGMLRSPLTLEKERSLILRDAQSHGEVIEQGIAALTHELLIAHERTGPFGSVDKVDKRGATSFEKQVFLEVRYQGQSHELQIPYDTMWQEKFHHLHHRLYGYAMKDKGLEVTGLRVALSFPRLAQDSMNLAIEEDHDIGHMTHSKGPVPVRFQDKTYLTPCIIRSMLKGAGRIQGPLIIIDDYTTILCPRDWTVHEENGNLFMRAQS